MAAAFVPVLPGLDDIVKWGIELTQFQYVVLMKRPKESATGSGLLAPFETKVEFFCFLLFRNCYSVILFRKNAIYIITVYVNEYAYCFRFGC